VRGTRKPDPEKIQIINKPVNETSRL